MRPKQIVCLANSRKTSGRCIAGKEWDGHKAGAWIRPISARSTHELSEEERRYANGADVRLLDIVRIPCIEPKPQPHQHENWLIDTGYYFERLDQLPWQELAHFTDQPQQLWQPRFSSFSGRNNRVPDSAVAGDSLYLIHVDVLKLLVGPKAPQYPDTKRAVRGEFSYRGLSYILDVTDPVIERQWLGQPDGNYVIEQAYLCVSLGDPWEGFCYKLIAAVLFEERFA